MLVTKGDPTKKLRLSSNGLKSEKITIVFDRLLLQHLVIKSFLMTVELLLTVTSINFLSRRQGANCGNLQGAELVGVRKHSVLLYVFSKFLAYLVVLCSHLCVLDVLHLGGGDVRAHGHEFVCADRGAVLQRLR